MAGDVRRPKQYEEMLRKLCQEDTKVFLTYKDALVFAACLGFQEGRRTAFDKTSEPVGMHIFKGDYDSAIFNCIGLVATQDPSIMGVDREQEKVRLFEEYACGGLEIIESRVYSATGFWDQLLLELVVSQTQRTNSVLENITHVFD